MLKGVNKQVVEVVEVDNEFFERAILFVKPEKQQNGEHTFYMQNGKCDGSGILMLPVSVALDEKQC